MEGVKTAFMIGEIMAYSGVIFSSLVMFYFLIVGNFNVKKHQKFFSIGVNTCFLGIFIMTGALAYGLFGVLK